MRTAIIVFVGLALVIWGAVIYIMHALEKEAEEIDQRHRGCGAWQDQD